MKIEMHAGTLRNSVEQRAMTHFFMLKRLKPQDIHAELGSVSSLQALARPTLKNW
jgi:hypothetical protein